MSDLGRTWMRRGAMAVACLVVFLGTAQIAETLRAQPRGFLSEAALRPAPVPPAPAVAKPAPAAASVPPAPPAAPPGSPPAAPPVSGAYVVKSVLPVKAPFVHGDWYWDERSAPAASGGKIVVTVDLKAQVLSVFRDGHEIGTAVMIYGADAKPTPLGVFQVSFRKAKHLSSTYNAPMPYTLRLTNDGVSIHGSAIMRPDAATHGCVGVPIAFARKLFGVVRLGDTVIVSNGETLAPGQAITAA